MKIVGRLLASTSLGMGALAMTSLIGVVPAAHAEGTGSADNVWQIGLSENCNNASACASNGGTGGFWGWAEFDQPTAMAPNSGNSADAQLTGCGHTVGGVGGPGGAGAGHMSMDATSWVIGPGSAGPATFLITGGTQTFNTQGGQVTMPITTDGNPPASDGSNVASPTNPYDTGIPAVPGHYNTADVFGPFTPPGISVEVQVSYRAARSK